MTSFTRNAKTVVYLVASGFLLVGAMNEALYLVKSHHDQTPVSVWRCLWLSIPLVIGLLILLKSSALARRIEEWLDE
jgi:hypothetical protein